MRWNAHENEVLLRCPVQHTGSLEFRAWVAKELPGHTAPAAKQQKLRLTARSGSRAGITLTDERERQTVADP